MTYLDRLKIEHPAWYLSLTKDFKECPEDYGYSSAKELCLCEEVDTKDLDNDICRRCWNQEMKEKST